MRPIWSGAISFGLVNIPVRLFSASRERTVPLHFLHRKDLSPVRYAKVCRRDGQEIASEDIVRGFEVRKGEYVALTDEELKRLDPKKSETLEIDEFVQARDIDPIYYDKPYFLEPVKGAANAYGILREALKRTDRVAVAKFVMREREYLAAIKPDGPFLLLNRLRFADEVRQPEGLKAGPARAAKKAELEMAVALIEGMTRPFAIEDYRDTYHAELKELIARKAAGKKLPKVRATKKAPAVHDLMDALKRSLEAAQSRKAA